jgi:hypothetical protein
MGTMIRYLLGALAALIRHIADELRADPLEDRDELSIDRYRHESGQLRKDQMRVIRDGKPVSAQREGWWL